MILVLIKDLVLSTQIRAACEENSLVYRSARSNEKFKEISSTANPELVIIDLNIDGADPFLALEEAKKAVSVDKILCFYSHVDTEVAEKALENGIPEDNVLRRSQFFTNIKEFIAIT